MSATNEGAKACECVNWEDVGDPFNSRALTGHHQNCANRGSIPAAMRSLVKSLVMGMEDWASDEDGIHPDAWQAYKLGKAFIGEFNWREEAQ